jgi:pimeloyl-ACP methyl ester carboxylesterase
MFGGGAPTSAEFGAPTLYLHGADDGAFGAEGLVGTSEHLPAGSAVRLLTGCGHFLHLERPDQVNELILDFVTKR